MTSFSFTLSKSFVEDYATRTAPFGFRDAGDNSLGELTFIRTYSRKKPDGTKERWHEACERVVNGMYSLQKNWCLANRLEWNGHKAQASAQEAYDRLFNLKWTPPGRGLENMGSKIVMDNGNAAVLYNCAVATTAMDRYDPAYPFQWTVEALAHGVGVGFDTAGAGQLTVNKPEPIELAGTAFAIPDSREGWGEAVSKLINSYLKPGQSFVHFDYYLLRPAGAPIKTLGGTASGPEPLREGLENIRMVLDRNVNKPISSETITDIMNIIATFVVAGGTRRSALLALGKEDDETFIGLKDMERQEERPWYWTSNNSVIVNSKSDYSKLAERTKSQGEPGYIWLDTARNYGRTIDAPDYADTKVVGFNPCAEIALEPFEVCNLAEVHIKNAESKEDYLRTLKFAYLYSKTVTLISTPWPKTNAVMLRNRRIGASQTGIAGFVDTQGLATYREWSDEGFHEIGRWDNIYSEWLAIRPSIRKTAVKPSGSVSLLSGSTPGVHWSPGGPYHMRAVRFGEFDPTWVELEKAGYTVEDDLYAAQTKVVYFPVHSDVKRGEKDVTIFEKAHLAAEAQRYWADNGVSVTVTFDEKEETEHVERILNMYSGQLKSISFLPLGNHTYAQQPYTQLTKEEYESYVGHLKKIDTSVLYESGLDALGEKYCTTDVCELPSQK